MWPFKKKLPVVESKYRPADGPVDLPAMSPDAPVPFGYKTTWWAIPTTDTELVARTIGIQHQQPVNWFYGVKHAHDRSIFVTPPVDGWTLIVGFYLPPNGDWPFKEVRVGLEALSREFEHAYVFSTHRIVDYHFWAKATRGEFIRGFGYLGERGELLGVHGDPTDVEQDMGYTYIDDPEMLQDDGPMTYEEMEEIDFPNEEHVMEVARGWSLCPCDFDGVEEVSASLGILGSRSDLLAHTD